jgi:hypothetical protein
MGFKQSDIGERLLVDIASLVRAADRELEIDRREIDEVQSLSMRTCNTCCVPRNFKESTAR